MTDTELLDELLTRLDKTNFARCDLSKDFQGWYDMWKRKLALRENDDDDDDYGSVSRNIWDEITTSLDILTE